MQLDNIVFAQLSPSLLLTNCSENTLTPFLCETFRRRARRLFHRALVSQLFSLDVEGRALVECCPSLAFVSGSGLVVVYGSYYSPSGWDSTVTVYLALGIQTVDSA